LPFFTNKTSLRIRMQAAMTPFFSSLPKLVPITLALAMVGCGDDPAPSASSTPTTLSGQVVKGPVGSANVCAYAISAGVRATATLVPCVTSDPNGNYTFSSFTYTGDVIVEATGGTYKNEATGVTTTLTEPLSTIVPAQGGSVTGYITPLTAIAVARSASLSSTAFAAAAGNVAAQAGLSGTNILTTAPSFGANSSAAFVTATNAYAAVLGALAQYQVANGNAPLATVLSAWGGNTAGFQAALQSALSAYSSYAGVLAANLPSALNLAATGAPLGFTVAVASGTSTTVSGGGFVSASSLTFTGAAAGFQPVVGLGFGITNTLGTISFVNVGATAASTQIFAVSRDSAGTEVTYQDGSGKEWFYSCVPAACAGRVQIDIPTKTVTLTNVTMTPDGGGATGNITVNGSATYTGQ
jgi:hypothetical protein